MIGHTLSHYEILDLLGSGGMGDVYRAQDTKLGREVAIKVLPEEFTADPERLARFEREAKVLASLNHPHIAQIHGLEEDDGQRFLVLELVEGETLAERISRGPIPVDEALPIARQIALALEAAHGRGIVHRDVKPANVMITEDGVAKVLDFGIARPLEAAAPGEETGTRTITGPPTRPGVVMGTPAYMSPEQLRSERADRRSDIWAFGVTLWEMLTGKRLFEGKTDSDTLAAVLQMNPDWQGLPPDAPAAVRRLLRRCLERDPKQRLHDIADARLEIEEPPELEGPPPEPAPRGRPLLRTVLPWSLAGLAILALIGSRSRTTNRPSPIPRPNFTQLTVQGGVEEYPSLSPDGKYFVYSAQSADGDLDIFLQRTGGMNPINLTGDSPDDDTHPAISPDGELITFSSTRDGGGVFVMGATGEAVRRVVGEGSRPAWSPDGREIVYETENFLSYWEREEISQLWIVGVDGEGRRLLFEGDAVHPDWSPHGHRIAFWSAPDETGGQRDIWTIRSDGTDARSVTSDPPLDWCPVWSHDGRHLYFASERGGPMNLWRVPIDEETGRTLGEPEPVTVPAHAVQTFAFSGDGRRIAYTSVTLTTHLYSMDFDPRARKAIGVPRQVTRGSLRVRRTDVSPDGQSIVFWGQSQQEDLYLVRADGSGLRKLTDDVHRDRGPIWTPDGERIVFYSNRGGRYEIWSIRPDGSELRQLSRTTGLPVYFPKLSPHGNLLAAINQEGTTLFEVDLESFELRSPELLPPISQGILFYAHAWSPDGLQLAGWAGARLASGEGGTALFTLEDGTYTTIAANIDGWPSIAWLPDGAGLLYEARDGVRVHDLHSGASTVVQGLELLGVTPGFTALAPDGRRIFLNVARTESDLWLATMK
jgi:serine/threonine protein kinase